MQFLTATVEQFLVYWLDIDNNRVKQEQSDITQILYLFATSQRFFSHTDFILKILGFLN